MKPYYDQDNIKLYLGDCLDVLRGLADNSVDSIITDPPYSINFMNKEWDNEIAFNPEVWRECLRIAKPGASLMAFGGTRTYHRLTCAIEDGGWEIRDCVSYFNDGTQQEQSLMASLDEEQLAAYLELHYPSNQMAWVYGQGFAKGANVSKMLDAAAVVDCQYCNGSGKGRPSYMVYCPEHGEIFGDNFLCPVCDGQAEEKELERESCNYCRGSGKVKGAERETIGERIKLGDKKAYPQNPNKDNEIFVTSEYQTPITAPATPLAKLFDGYGSALKPAFEPIVVAMKPLEGTYANNAEVWGVSGLNIDGCRIGVEDNDKNKRESTGGVGNITNGTTWFTNKTRCATLTHGRWPANIIHDSSPDVLAEFDKAGPKPGPWGKGKSVGRIPSWASSCEFRFVDNGKYQGESDSAARFFQSCPPDAAQINPCLTCQECVTEDEPEADQPPGRWPANVISDGSAAVEREFDKAGVRVSGAKKLIQTKNKADGVINDGSGFNTNKLRIHNDKTVLEASKGSAARYYQKCPPDSEPARFRYCPKASKSERCPYNNHPTVKPLSLVRYLCRLTKTPYGGIVLDPFVGSGTTLLAARAEGRPAIGIDLDEGYCRICVGRLEGGDPSTGSGEGEPLRQAQAGPAGRQLRLF